MIEHYELYVFVIIIPFPFFSFFFWTIVYNLFAISKQGVDYKYLKMEHAIAYDVSTCLNDLCHLTESEGCSELPSVCLNPSRLNLKIVLNFLFKSRLYLERMPQLVSCQN